MSGGHSGEEIPVPIPHTDVKLTNADDTALRCGKVGSCQAFFLFNIYLLWAATYVGSINLAERGGM